MRANAKNLRQRKDELMREWKITEEQWDRLIELALKRSWEEFHTLGHHPSHAQVEYMSLINKAVDGHGVESLHPGIEFVQYVNMGDPYVTTLLLWQGKLYLGCWGDLGGKILCL